MRKIFGSKPLMLIVATALTATFTGISAGAAGDVVISEANFPNEVFRSYISENFDTDSNGTLSKDEIVAATEICFYTSGVTNLDGIEYFTELTKLECANDELTSIDVSKNTALEYLDVGNNQLTNIDVSKNTALVYLDVSTNRLTSIDVSKNTALESLRIDANQITSIDVSKNTALKLLNAGSNEFTSIDLSKNTALESLIHERSLLTSVDVSNNTKLDYLDIMFSQFTSIDVSKNVALGYFYADYNQLTSIDVSNNTALELLSIGNNQLKSIDVSKNTALKKLGVYQNQLTSLDIEGTVVDGLRAYMNSFTLHTASLNELRTYGFDPEKASNWTGATYDYATNSLKDITADTVTYVYDVGNDSSVTFTLVIDIYETPQNIRITAGDSKVTMTWDKVTGATKYAVYMLENGAYVCKSNAVTSTSYTFTGLANGTKYSFKVKAYVNGTWKTASNMVVAIPFA